MDEGELRGYHAITLLHDPKSVSWSLHWMTSRTSAAIDPPVSGQFTGAVGDSLGPDAARARWPISRRASL